MRGLFSCCFTGNKAYKPPTITCKDEFCQAITILNNKGYRLNHALQCHEIKHVKRSAPIIMDEEEDYFIRCTSFVIHST